MQNVRAVWNGDEWGLRFICKVEIKTTDSVGDEVASIDLGITNIATVAFPDEYVLYPGNSLKQDKHYFTRTEYETVGENDPSEKSIWARRKLGDRETHFYYVLTDAIITECVERGVGTLAVSWPEDVRDGVRLGGRFVRENRSYRRPPNIPTAVREVPGVNAGEDVTTGTA